MELARLISLFLLLLALVSVGARGGEFEQFERKATAVRLWCDYQGDYFGAHQDRHGMLWTYDGETLAINGQSMESGTFRAKAGSIIVDLSEFVKTADLFLPNGEVHFFLRIKYYVNFSKKVSVLTIGDHFTVRGHCRNY